MAHFPPPECPPEALAPPECPPEALAPLECPLDALAPLLVLRDGVLDELRTLDELRDGVLDELRTPDEPRTLDELRDVVADELRLLPLLGENVLRGVLLLLWLPKLRLLVWRVAVVRVLLSRLVLPTERGRLWEVVLLCPKVREPFCWVLVVRLLPPVTPLWLRLLLCCVPLRLPCELLRAGERLMLPPRP